MPDYDILSFADGSSPVNMKWHPSLHQSIEIGGETHAYEGATFPYNYIDEHGNEEWSVEHVANPALDGGDLTTGLLALFLGIPGPTFGANKKVLKYQSALGDVVYCVIVDFQETPIRNGRRKTVRLTLRRVDYP